MYVDILFAIQYVGRIIKYYFLILFVLFETGGSALYLLKPAGSEGWQRLQPRG